MKPQPTPYDEVEAVAKALFAHSWGKRRTWEQFAEKRKDIAKIYLQKAKIAIATLEKLRRKEVVGI